MNRHARELRKLTEDFLRERQPFAEFHQGFIDLWTRLPAGSLTPEARARWNTIYSLVLTAVPDPVGPGDGASGVIGEAELRQRLRRDPLLADRP